jgi:hypothetical protein
MAGTMAAITQPIALCAYVISAVFGLLARKWNSQGNRPRDRQLFYLAATLSLVALGGGLLLAWHQLPKPTLSTTPGPVVQSSSGDQSPNVNSSGSGEVTVQSGTAPAPPPEKPKENKK